jgi:hypothetical protein
MTNEELALIAERPTCCKPFGESVSLSRAERDQLVALARDGMLLREKFTSGNAIQVERVTVRFDELAPSPCNCAKCRPHSMEMRMILCSKCGNKRCPHATDHRNACTGSNERGQAGSAYA